MPAFAKYRRVGLAGALSCILHVTLLVLGVLLLRGNQLGDFPVDLRATSVVLVSRQEQSVRYYEESELREMPSDAREIGSRSTNVPPALHALPASEQPPVANIALHLPGLEILPAVSIDSANAALAGGVSLRPIIDPAAGVAEIMEEEAKRVRPSGPVGAPTSVSLFGSRAAHGHTFMFVIDRSQSMGAEGLGALAAAESELLANVKKLQPHHAFQIVAYNDTLKYIRERRLLAASPENFAATEEFLQTLAAHGPTEHTTALLSALRLKPDVIYLFTDGDDPYLGEKQRQRIHTAAAEHTRISCVQFGWKQPVNELSRECLEALARENGGSYTFVDMSTRLKTFTPPAR